MINVILKRSALALSVLWVLVTFMDFGLIFALVSAGVFLGFVWILCWILGPVGRLGSSQEQYNCSARKMTSDLRKQSYR